MELRRVPNLVTQDMGEFVNGYVHEHVHWIVLLVLILEAKIDFLFIQGVRFGVGIEFEFLYTWTQQRKVFTDLMKNGIRLLVLLATKVESTVQNE